MVWFVIKFTTISGVLLGTLANGQQPALTVPAVNTPCQDGPKEGDGKPDLVETPLEDGFVSLFNGKDMTGWWENCASHTKDTRLGDISL
ncbi:MAG TPA: hypothetical protein VK465_10340 [Fibrobacteria bacterium]|nr:hypothetical protein [Fibrobacteria bacterium]